MQKRTVAPRASTPALRTPISGSTFGWLPGDIVEQTCKRVGTAAVVFAAVWAWALLMNNAVWRLFPTHAHELAGWTRVDNVLSGAGLVLSLGMVLVARSLHARPRLLLNVGLGFEVATAALIGALNWSGVAPLGIGISWVCVIILVYPAIVPVSPQKILAASLVAATMDPLWYVIGLQRGMDYGLDGFGLLWAFAPNYVCAFLAVVPAKVISGLGRRVFQARELGAYRLGDVLGKGGMGEVYRATHRLLARPAAIKLIRPDVLGATGSDAVRVSIERFRREAHAAANLRSPHTIELYDFGFTDDGNLYYVMELLDGLDLQELVERFGPLPPARVIYLLKQACLSLGEAHELGLVHRDVKPSNLVACRMGLGVDFLKILDFGLVKQTVRPDAEHMLLTSPNVTTGTPAFMAPEVALGGGAIDGRSDLYALGCVGYWLLTGRTVFEAPSAVAMLMSHVRETPQPPSRASELEIPPELDRIILDCLAKDPDERPQTASELYRRLAECPVPDAWSRDRALAWWTLHLPELFESGKRSVDLVGVVEPEAQGPLIVPAE